MGAYGRTVARLHKDYARIRINNKFWRTKSSLRSTNNTANGVLPSAAILCPRWITVINTYLVLEDAYLLCTSEWNRLYKYRGPHVSKSKCRQ